MKQVEEIFQETTPVLNIANTGYFLPHQEEVYGILPTAYSLSLYDKAWKDK